MQADPSIQAVILLRGLIREQRHWMGFDDILIDSLPNIPVITMDVAGNGQENNSKSSCRICELRKELAMRFSHQYPQYQNIGLVALSMGGMIAVDWAQAEPERIKKVVLINSSFKGISPFYFRLRWHNYLKILALLFSSKMNKEKIILSLTSNNRISSDKQFELLKRWHNIAEQSPVSLINAFKQLLAAARFRFPKSVNHVQMLIIASRKDALVDYRSSVILANYVKQAHLVIHPTGGHDLALDEPNWLAQQISGFIGSI